MNGNVAKSIISPKKPTTEMDKKIVNNNLTPKDKRDLKRVQSMPPTEKPKTGKKL